MSPAPIRRPRVARGALAASLVALLALSGCTGGDGLRHEGASLPTRNVLPVDQQGDGGDAVRDDDRTRLRALLLSSDAPSIAADPGATRLALDRVKACGTECLIVAPPALLKGKSYQLVTVPSPDRKRPGAAFAFYDDGHAPRLALVVTGYDVYLGKGTDDTLVAIAGTGPDASDPNAVAQTRYKAQDGGRLVKVKDAKSKAESKEGDGS